MASREKVLSIAGWTVVWLMTLMLVFVFGNQGVAKFSDTSGWARAFAHWGYPVWFRLLIGVLEVLAAVLILWPRTAPIGAAIIIVVMLGGMGTHIVKDNGRHMTSEVMPIVFASVILFARRRQWMPRTAVRGGGGALYGAGTP
jgi:putative oxidoreductase